MNKSILKTRRIQAMLRKKATANLFNYETDKQKSV